MSKNDEAKNSCSIIFYQIDFVRNFSGCIFSEFEKKFHTKYSCNTKSIFQVEKLLCMLFVRIPWLNIIHHFAVISILQLFVFCMNNFGQCFGQ